MFNEVDKIHTCDNVYSQWFVYLLKVLQFLSSNELLNCDELVDLCVIVLVVVKEKSKVHGIVFYFNFFFHSVVSFSSDRKRNKVSE